MTGECGSFGSETVWTLKSDSDLSSYFVSPGAGGREGEGQRGGRRLISENHEQLVIRVYSNQKVIKFPVSELSGGWWLWLLTPVTKRFLKS